LGGIAKSRGAEAYELKEAKEAASKPSIASKKTSSSTWKSSPAAAISSPKPTPASFPSIACDGKQFCLFSINQLIRDIPGIPCKLKGLGYDPSEHSAEYESVEWEYSIPIQNPQQAARLE
jgi:hypothetical protein